MLNKVGIMNLDTFIKKYNGKKIDFDGHYQNQCMDLYRFYVSEVLELPQSPGVSSAYQVFDTASTKDYDKIRNTPSGVPKKGDIIIWQKGYGGYGHIAIVVDANVNGILSFDQNHTGRLDPCQLVNHNYNLVLGWLHPRGGQMEGRTLWFKTKKDADVYKCVHFLDPHKVDYKNLITGGFDTYEIFSKKDIVVHIPNPKTMDFFKLSWKFKDTLYPSKDYKVIEAKVKGLNTQIKDLKGDVVKLERQLEEEKKHGDQLVKASKKCREDIEKYQIALDIATKGFEKYEINWAEKAIRYIKEVTIKILKKLNWIEE